MYLRHTAVALFLAILSLCPLGTPAAFAAAVVDQTWGGAPVLTPQAPPTAGFSKKYGMVAADAIDRELATRLGNVLLSPAALNAPLKIQSGVNPDGSTGIFYLATSFDGQTPAIWRVGDFSPVLTQNELPGGQRLVSSQNEVNFGVSGGKLIFTGFDPNLTLNNQPIKTIYSKPIGGTSLTTLLDRSTTFNAVDPKSGTTDSVPFSYLQAVGFKVTRRGVVTVFVLASPPKPTGFPGDPIPEAIFLQLRPDGSWNPLFNNQIGTGTKDTQLTSVSAFDVSEAGVLYLVGQSTASPPSTDAPNQLSAFRVVSGKIVQVKPYADFTGAFIDGGDAGVQVYTVNLTDKTTPIFTYSYIPDTSAVVGTPFTTGESTIYAGTVVDTVTLNTTDFQYYASPTDVYVVTAAHGLLRMSTGRGGKIIKSASQSPSGNAVSITMVDGTPLYLQAENVGRAYWLYQPTVQTPISPRQGDTVTFTGDESYVDGQLPSMTLNMGGKNVPVGVLPNASGTGVTYSFVAPRDVAPGTYQGLVYVGGVTGIILPVTVNLRAATELPTPAITSFGPATLDPTAGEKGPLSPRATVAVTFTGALGTAESAPDGGTALSLGGIILTLSDGTPFRLLSNSGQGRLVAMVPSNVALKAQDAATLTVTSGASVSSAPFTIAIAPRFDTLYRYTDLEGSQVPFLVDDTGKLVGGRLSAAPAGSTVTGYGTGCGLTGSLGDDQNPGDDSITDPNPPSLNIAGTSVQVTKVALVPGLAGTCAYTFTLPQGVSGVNKLWFGGDVPVGPVYQIRLQ